MTTQVEQLRQLARAGDREAAQALLVEAARRNDLELMQVAQRCLFEPAPAWPGCALVGRNEQGFAELRHARTGLIFVEIPAGEYRLGHPREAANLERVLTLPSYLIAKFPVTGVVFLRAFDASEGHASSRDSTSKTPLARSLPGSERSTIEAPKDVASLGPVALVRCATHIDWHEAQRFCAWAGLVLPTGDEWEVAARGPESAPEAPRIGPVRTPSLWAPDPLCTPVATSGFGLGWVGVHFEWAANFGPTPELRQQRCSHLYRALHARADARASYFAFRPILRAISGSGEHAAAVPDAWADAAATELHERRFLLRLDEHRSALRPQPLGAKQRRELVAFARTLDTLAASWRQHDPNDWESLGLRRDPSLDSRRIELADGGLALSADLGALHAPTLLRSFPRDKRGLLELDCDVALAAYPSKPDEHRWLVARGPKKRKDPAAVTWSLGEVDPLFVKHRFDGLRYLWDRRRFDDAPASRWGFTPPGPLRELRGDEATYARLSNASGLSPDEKALLALLRLDRGEVVAAFEGCGVAVDPSLLELLEGNPTSELHLANLDAWAQTCSQRLAQAAPWRFAAVLADEAARLQAWRSAKKGRPKKLPWFKLFSLPGQTAVRKVCVCLTATDLDGNGPRLVAEMTGSEGRLAPEYWTRSLDLELASLT